MDCKIYLKIPIGVIYYVCDPRTPRRNLCFMENANYICDKLWRMLLQKMPEIEPLGGLRLYFHRQYILPPRTSKNHRNEYCSTHESLTEKERKVIGKYISEIKAANVEEKTGITIGMIPMFFFRCPHPGQARLGFDTKKAVEEGEFVGETVFLWGWADDMSEQEIHGGGRLDRIIYLLYCAIFFHWNREDIGITSINALKCLGSDNPNIRYENFKKAVWKGEAFIQKLIYLNPNDLDFGVREEDEYVFEKITDLKGKPLDKISDGDEIQIELYSQEDEYSEAGEFCFVSRVSSSDKGVFTNALFRITFIDLELDDSLSYDFGCSDLFSYFFPKKEEQNKAIDYYLRLQEIENEKYREYTHSLSYSIKTGIESDREFGSEQQKNNCFSSNTLQRGESTANGYDNGMHGDTMSDITPFLKYCSDRDKCKTIVQMLTGCNSVEALKNAILSIDADGKMIDMCTMDSIQFCRDIISLIKYETSENALKQVIHRLVKPKLKS